MIKTSLFTFLLAFGCSVGFAQSPNTVDSSLRKLANAKDDTSRVMGLNDLSYSYWIYKPDSAFFFAQQALDLARQIKFPRGQSRAFNCLGLINSTLGNSSAALELFLKGLDVAEKNNINDEIKAEHIYNIGYSYLDVQDYSKAINYMQQAKHLYDSLHNHYFKQLVENNLAEAYLQMDQLDSATKYGQEAYNDMIRFRGDSIYTLYYLGLIQAKKGNTQPALEYFKQGLANSINENNYVKNSEIYFGIAKVYQQINKLDSSIYYAQKSLADAQQGKLYNNMILAGNFLAELYAGNDFQKGYQYSKIAVAAKDSLYNMGKRNAFRNIADFNKKERQYEIETATTAYQNKARQYALLSGLGVFLLVAFILYRNNLQKQKANKVLESTLADLKSTQSQLIQSEKMASLGELTAGIAHEIQNPLNFVNNFSEVNSELIEELKSEQSKIKRDEQLEEELLNDIAENEKKINHHGKRADAIVKGMLQHSQTSTGQKEPTNINKLADEYLRLSYQGLRAKDNTFNAILKIDFDDSVGNINIIPQDIGRVLLNLYNNAFYAVNEKQKAESLKTRAEGKGYEPTISVSTKRIGGKSDSNRIEIKVADNGPGIPQKIADKIFQPFFTTKPTGQGTGLGLSLSYDIIKAHGGEIKVETKENEGSAFIILLPFDKEI